MGSVFSDIADVRQARKQVFGVRWDDLRFPVGGINPQGADVPSVDADTGLFIFPKATIAAVAGLAQMPHAWLEESAVGPHIHWVQTAPGNAYWRFDTRVFCPVNCDFPEDWTTVYANSTTHAYPGSGSRVMITPFPAPDMTGQKISSMVLFRFARLSTNALDTMDADLRLLEFDIHHQLDGNGSEGLFSK